MQAQHILRTDAVKEALKLLSPYLLISTARLGLLFAEELERGGVRLRRVTRRKDGAYEKEVSHHNAAPEAPAAQCRWTRAEAEEALKSGLYTAEFRAELRRALDAGECAE